MTKHKLPKTFGKPINGSAMTRKPSLWLTLQALLLITILVSMALATTIDKLPTK